MTATLPPPLCAAEADALIAKHRAEAQAAPEKDLIEFASDFGQLALTLTFIGEGLDRAQEAADESHNARLRHGWDIDGANLAYQNEIMAARRTAAATAQKAMVDLSRLIGELQWERK